MIDFGRKGTADSCDASANALSESTTPSGSAILIAAPEFVSSRSEQSPKQTRSWAMNSYSADRDAE